MQIGSLAIKLRNVTPMAAADMGMALARMQPMALWRCLLPLWLLVTLFALALNEIASWLPWLIIWWCKPWLDRVALFVLSRAAFGQSTTLHDLWHSQAQVLWQQWWLTMTWRRLSPWRALTQPVYQLEGHRLRALGKRVKQIRRGTSGSAMLVASAFGLAELVLISSLAFLIQYLYPSEKSFEFFTWLTMPTTDPSLRQGLIFTAYALVILVLEPFYVATGFGMYLNRRVALEAWDIEQELHRVLER